MSLLSFHFMSWQTMVHTGFYLLGNVVRKGIIVIFLPVLLVALTPEQYTRFGLLMSVLTLIPAILAVMTYSAPSRLYFDYLEDNNGSSYLFSVLAIGMLNTLIGLGVLLGTMFVFDLRDPICQGNSTALWLTAVAIFFQTAMEFGFEAIRVKGKAHLFFSGSVVRAVALIGSFYLLQSVVEDGILRVISSVLIANCLTAIFVVPLSLGISHLPKLQFEYFKKSLLFSWPLLIHYLSVWSLSQSGRWIGTLYLTMEEMAPYVLISQLSLGGMLIVRSIVDAKQPRLGRAFARGDLPEAKRIAIWSTVQAAIILTLLFTVLYFVLCVFDIEMLKSYRPSKRLFFYAYIACVFDALRTMGFLLLSGLKETKLLAACTLLSGLTSVICCFPLAKHFGDLGLVQAMALGLAIQAITTNGVGWMKAKQAQGAA